MTPITEAYNNVHIKLYESEFINKLTLIIIALVVYIGMTMFYEHLHSHSEQR